MSVPNLTIYNNEQLIALLKAGAVCVMPTDTVYGVVCSARLPESVARLYALKPREKKPGTLIAASIDQLVALGIRPRYLNSVAHLWPNPISVVVPDEASLSYLDQGLRSLAVRVPLQEDLRRLLHVVGPLLTTSANKPGAPVSNTVKEAIAYFGDAVDCYVDGGDLSGRPPSTLVRVVDDAIEVLRHGAIDIDGYGRILTPPTAQ